MKARSLGFIGGGRVTRIILGALGRTGGMPRSIVVSDTSQQALEWIKGVHPTVRTVPDGNADAGSQDIVVIALHPPSMADAASGILAVLKSDAIILSVMPKLTIATLSAMLGGHEKIVRIIPNAPAIVGKGFNPIAFGRGMPDSEKNALRELLSPLGECPEVPEDLLEAYAVLTAMGPTYLWFQLYELEAIARSFGLSETAAQEAITKMAEGAIATMKTAGMPSSEVMDLVPAKPLGQDEEVIRTMYRSRLSAIFGKLRG